MMFKECYALEKVHGTSAHITWKYEENKIILFSGGGSHHNFVKLFNEQELKEEFKRQFPDSNVVIYGESYGGRQQGMKETYGLEQRFVAFDVKVGNTWLNVPNAEQVCGYFNIEFVDYVKIPTDVESINAQRDRESVQAIRNGMGEGKIREGVVLRPLKEFTDNRGNRVILKHKRDEFKETATSREIDPERLKILEDAEEIANEWVTPMRLEHVLDKLPEVTGIEFTGTVVRAMIEDVYREAEGEIIESQEVKKAIGSKAAKLFKQKIQTITDER